MAPPFEGGISNGAAGTSGCARGSTPTHQVNEKSGFLSPAGISGERWGRWGLLRGFFQGGFQNLFRGGFHIDLVGPLGQALPEGLDLVRPHIGFGL